MKKTTIKDVAKASDVGIATVSRVVNGNYPVSDAVRKRVMEAIAELDYRPDGAARSLKTKKTFLVGVVIADLSNAFFMQLVKGIEQELSIYGYSIIIADHEENPEKERKIVEMFLEKKVAAIVTTTCHTSGDYFASLSNIGVPILFVDRLIDGLEADTVVEDNESNSFEIVKHMIECGHRKIAVVTGDIKVHTAGSRYKGYIKALTRYDIPIEEKYIISGRHGFSYENIKEMFCTLSRDEWPTAIFATNNMRAEGTLRACLDLNISVPDDVSVGSYGDISMPWLFSLKLTHVDQDMVRIGQKTGEMLLNKIDAPSSGFKQYIINSHIIMGNSIAYIADSDKALK